jgi:hypothetical protein
MFEEKLQVEQPGPTAGIVRFRTFDVLWKRTRNSIRAKPHSI